MCSCLKILIHIGTTTYLHNKQCTYKSQMLYVYIRNFFFTVYFFLVCHQADMYQFKKGHLQINFRLFWTRKKWRTLIIVKYSHIYIKHILKHVWNHIFSLFSELFRENWKKMPACNQKKGLNLRIYFQFTPSCLLLRRFRTIWNTFWD